MHRSSVCFSNSVTRGHSFKLQKKIVSSRCEEVFLCIIGMGYHLRLSILRRSTSLKTDLIPIGGVTGIASLGNMQITNSRLGESIKCWVYSAVNHPWWMSMLFHRRGFCGLDRLFVTFGGSGGMMTTARPGLPM